MTQSCPFTEWGRELRDLVAFREAAMFRRPYAQIFPWREQIWNTFEGGDSISHAENACDGPIISTTPEKTIQQTNTEAVVGF
jgi:hypothetical protein